MAGSEGSLGADVGRAMERGWGEFWDKNENQDPTVFMFMSFFNLLQMIAPKPKRGKIIRGATCPIRHGMRFQTQLKFILPSQPCPQIRKQHRITLKEVIRALVQLNMR